MHYVRVPLPVGQLGTQKVRAWPRIFKDYARLLSNSLWALLLPGGGHIHEKECNIKHVYLNLPSMMYQNLKPKGWLPRFKGRWQLIKTHVAKMASMENQFPCISAMDPQEL